MRKKRGCKEDGAGQASVPPCICSLKHVVGCPRFLTTTAMRKTKAVFDRREYNFIGEALARGAQDLSSTTLNYAAKEMNPLLALHQSLWYGTNHMSEIQHGCYPSTQNHIK